jgi:deoxyribodipyrimidine photolyase-related protein
MPRPRQALKALEHFVPMPCRRSATIRTRCWRDRFLYHSLLSAYINIGLLGPLEVCRAVAEAYGTRGDVPINAAEGFIRQIIGWREYVRGIYFREGPDYPTQRAGP